jgi:sortase B
MTLIGYSGFVLYDTVYTDRTAFISSDLSQYRPVETEEEPTFEEMMEINPDTCAWVTMLGTHIDYPIVQGKDDVEYANKDIYGKSCLTGAIYLTTMNSNEFTDSFNLIYGHHMDNGAMFGDVLEFRKAKYFRDHKAGHLYLAEGSMDIVIFACVTCDAYDEQFYSIADKSPETMGDFLQVIQKNACQYREIDLQPTDRLIALSTCMNGSTNGRCMIIGRLVDPA